MYRTTVAVVRFLRNVERVESESWQLACKLHIGNVSPLHMYMYMYMYIASLRVQPHVQVTALGVLCCFALFVCLTLLASFFHLSFSIMHLHTYKYYYMCNLMYLHISTLYIYI